WRHETVRRPEPPGRRYSGTIPLNVRASPRKTDPAVPARARTAPSPRKLGDGTRAGAARPAAPGPFSEPPRQAQLSRRAPPGAPAPRPAPPPPPRKLENGPKAGAAGPRHDPTARPAGRPAPLTSSDREGVHQDPGDHFVQVDADRHVERERLPQ